MTTREDILLALQEVRHPGRQDKTIVELGMVHAIDIGEAANIHPANKQDVGRRLALEAERIAYGKKIVSRGPLFRAAKEEKVELTVFAAASLQETLTEIGNNYMAEHENVTLTFNFDSSGTLKTQIESGADCDIFISAGQKQMDQLDSTASADVNPDGLDFVLQGTRADILENKVTLAVPEGNPAGIESFDQLAERLKAGDVFMAMGNEDVPVGQYTQKIFEYYGLSEAELAQEGLITYGSNVKEVTSQVAEAAVDCPSTPTRPRHSWTTASPTRPWRSLNPWASAPWDNIRSIGRRNGGWTGFPCGTPCALRPFPPSLSPQ